MKGRAQRGVTIPLVAVFIFVLLAMAALAIDMGVLYTARTSAQHAADAAALAGAFSFLNPVAVQPGAAVDAAISVASQNRVIGQAVAITAANVVVDVPNRRVTVTVPRTGGNGVGTYFAKALGKQMVDVVARATAEAAEEGGASRCLKPIYIPTTVLSALPPDQACANNERIFDNSGNLTQFAISKMGQQMSIRPTNPANSLEPGQFYSLDFGSGANTYSCSIGQCLNDCNVDTAAVQCGNSYPLKTGNMVGPTKQGVQDLIGSPADQWVAISQYRHTDGNVYDTSRSLAIAPVWDNCSQSVSPGYHGQAVKITGFLQIFVDGMAGQDLQAHFVQPIPCENFGGNGGIPSETGANTGPYGVPVRLVQTLPAQ